MHVHSTRPGLSLPWWLLSKNKSCNIFYDLVLEITDHSPMPTRLSGGHVDLTSQRKECLSYSKEITRNDRRCCHHLGKYNLLHFTSFCYNQLLLQPPNLIQSLLLSLWTPGSKYIWCILEHCSFVFIHVWIHSYSASESLFKWTP